MSEQEIIDGLLLFSLLCTIVMLILLIIWVLTEDDEKEIFITKTILITACVAIMSIVVAFITHIIDLISWI